MTYSLIEEQADLTQKPALPSVLPSESTAVTIGDLHGNTMKFLYFLIKEGFCDISDAAYKKLVSLYPNTRFHPKVAREKTIEAIRQFEACLLTELKPLDVKGLIRLIGDEMADRGSNDYLTLVLLSWLKTHNYDYEILFSNHGAIFLSFCSMLFEKQEALFNLKDELGQFCSVSHLLAFYKHGLNEEQKALARMRIREHYLPYIKLLSYDLDQNNEKITFYSHAPIDLHALPFLCKQFKLPLRTQTPVELARTIDLINQAFSSWVRSLKAHRFCELPLCHEILKPKPLVTVKNAVTYVAWNRCYTHLDKAHPPPYPIHFVHGHDSNLILTQPHRDTLDSMLGKAMSDDIAIMEVSQGTYLCARVTERALKATRKRSRDENPSTQAFFLSSGSGDTIVLSRSASDQSMGTP